MQAERPASPWKNTKGRIIMQNKNYLRFMSLLCAGALAMSLTACGSKETNTDTAADSSANTADTAAAAKVEPLVNNLAIDGSQDDVTFAATFSASTITKEGDAYSIGYTAYAMQLFDEADVTALKAGDTIVLEGKDVVVDTLEENNGIYKINGGFDEGGYDLSPSTENEGCYYESTTDNYGFYEELGSAELPVSADCVIKDSSDGIEKQLTMDDVVSDTGSFDQFNTTITVSGGEITEITRTFRP